MEMETEPESSNYVKSKRNSISLSKKVEILHCIGSGMKKKLVAAKFNIPASTLSTILKQKAKILESHSQNVVGVERKRLRSSPYEDIEEALFLWFKDIRGRNVPINGPIIKEKAESLAFLLGHEGFTANSGWLARFNKRHNLSSKVVSGESNSVDVVTVENWLDANLPEILATYRPRDVFNADETGLFYKMTPQRTFAVRGESCHGGKLSKERITVLLCANMDGSETMKPLVIGKSCNPRCFKGIKSLPVDYKNQRKAWMTRALFEDWLRKFDEKMASKKRKVLLLVDNCSSHNTELQLEAVTLKFLPPNTTSKLQPLDQGIIYIFKVNYRKRLLQRLIMNIDQHRESKIDLKMAIEMLAGAWWQVKPQSISRCWKKCGFHQRECHDEPRDEGRNEDDNEPEPSDGSSNEDVWEFAREQLRIPNDVAFNDFVQMDDYVITSVELTDEELINSVKKTTDNTGENDSDEQPSDELPVKMVSSADALDAICALRSYLEAGDSPIELLQSVTRMEDFVMASVIKKTVQKKITDYMNTA